MSNENTPLWLDIKTEYIDANLDKVISYLSKEAFKSSHDSFYYETLSLIQKRVDELIELMSERDIWLAEESLDNKTAQTQLRILGASLLIKDSRFKTSEWNFFFFVKILISLVPDNNIEELTEMAIRSLLYKVEQLGFSWSDINNIQPEILAHKLINVTKFNDKPYSESWYQHKGSICLNGGVINIYIGNHGDKTIAKAVPSLQLQDGMILVKTAPSDRIQKKDEDNIEVIDKFTNAFIREADKTKPEPLIKLKKYATGDIMPVRYIGKDVYGNFLVETVEGDYEKISGELTFNGEVYLQYYTNETVLSSFNEQDIFEAEYIGGKYNEFSIEKTFLSALIDNTIESGTEKNAVLKKVSPNKPSVWWTEDGYPAYVEKKDDPGTYTPGDTAILFITGSQTNGYVYATIVRPSDDPVDEEKSKQYCAEGMLYDEDYKPKVLPTIKTTDRIVVKGLLRLLFNFQRCITQAAERFRILSTCRILAAMIEDTVSLEYIDLSCTYLKNLLAFASDRIDKIKAIQPVSYMAGLPSIIMRQKVTRLLQAYGVDEDADLLSNIIHDPNEEPILVQLAKLIQSCNRIDDIYPAIKTVIKREITKFLAVETEDNADFEEAVGPNLGVENSRQEFKTSFFFAHPKAYEQNQEKNIFRSLCAFLNTQDGGTLYLGVNDSGGINGLENDIEHLEKKVIGNYKGIDGYIRYITDRAKDWFDLDVRIHFKIEPIYDGKVVAINVEPYQHGVVEFDGIPYIRNNSESVKMSQTLRRQIESRRLTSNQERSKNLVSIAEAIREQRQVTLYGYASSSGNDIIERHLEPYALVGNNTYVWAYDKDECKNKVFRISRIGNVRIGDSWQSKQLHKKGEMDVFHCIGETKIAVKLELDMLAHNLLIEEYPDSEKELSSTTEGKWILKTNVLDIHGVGRFYCGLADHIKIIDGAQLIEYARRYFDDGLKRVK